MKRLIAALLVLATAGGVAGYYDRQADAEIVPIIHVVEDGETLWDICRVVADEKDADVRDVIFQTMMDNDVAIDATIYPGQKLKIRK